MRARRLSVASTCIPTANCTFPSGRITRKSANLASGPIRGIIRRYRRNCTDSSGYDHQRRLKLSKQYPSLGSDHRGHWLPRKKRDSDRRTCKRTVGKRRRLIRRNSIRRKNVPMLNHYDYFSSWPWRILIRIPNRRWRRKLVSRRSRRIRRCI